MAINLVLLTVLLIAALWTVLTTRLIRAVVGLAVTSAILSIIIFRLDSGLAAVFELSVCAGLIPVIFITTVSFTERMSKERFAAFRLERLGKFWLLPVLLVLCAAVLFMARFKLDFNLPMTGPNIDTRNIIWYLRHMDLLGQVLILLAGAFAVVVLFKENFKK